MQNLFTPRIADSRVQSRNLLTSSEDLCRSFHVVDGNAAVESNRKILRAFGSHQCMSFSGETARKCKLLSRIALTLAKKALLDLNWRFAVAAGLNKFRMEATSRFFQNCSVRSDTLVSEVSCPMAKAVSSQGRNLRVTRL